MGGGGRQTNQTRLGKEKFEALLNYAYDHDIRQFDQFARVFLRITHEFGGQLHIVVTDAFYFKTVFGTQIGIVDHTTQHQEIGLFDQRIERIDLGIECGWVGCPVKRLKARISKTKPGGVFSNHKVRFCRVGK